MKGYVKGIGFRREHGHLWIDVDFESTEEKARSWPDKRAAEDEAGMLEQHEIAITTAQGQRHVCKGYKVAERAPGQFVIWVDAPFVVTSGTDHPKGAASGR